MKGDFAKAYSAGKQAYREQRFNAWEYVFIFLVVLVALASFEGHWLPWYTTLLILVPVALGYGVIKGILQRKKVQQPKE